MRKHRYLCINSLFFLFFAFIFNSKSISQISDHSTPVSFGISGTTKSLKRIPSRTLDSVNVSVQKEWDRKNGVPNRFGIVQKAQINIREEGIKTQNTLSNIWRYKIKCPDAKALGFLFQEFLLPPGAGLYIYTSDTTIVKGAYTSKNNKEYSKLSIGAVAGNEVIIEYNEPSDALFEGEVELGSIFTAYQGFGQTTSSYIDINCVEGTDWQNQKRAVCLMLFAEENSWYNCSGTLINNIKEDGTPFFLTANHCISSEESAQTLVTYFNYENSKCDGNDASADQSLSGATLLSTSDYNDFTLLKLSADPPDEYDPYFAGWNADDNAEPASGTCIHHPEGGPKAIAIDNDAPVSYPYQVIWDNNIRTQANTHWQVSYDKGADASGSSGSPLFDENKRIIGQLHGGDDEISLFGKFSLSWNHSSNSSEQLMAWLDPDNSGTLILDGLSHKAPTAMFQSDVSMACVNTTVYLTDESSGSPSSWEWEISPSTYKFVGGTDAHAQNPEVVFTKEGTYDVTLIASNDMGADTKKVEDFIEAKSEFSVSFIDFNDELTTCGNSIENLKMIATGAETYDFKIVDEDFFDYAIGSDTLTISTNSNARENGSFDTYVIVSGGHGSCIDSDSVHLHINYPENDNIDNAISLQLGYNGIYSNKCGTIQDNEPAPPDGGCDANAECTAGTADEYDNSTWFSFRGPSNGQITIKVEGVSAQIAIYSDNSTDETPSGFSSSFSLVAASAYSNSPAIENLRVNSYEKYWLQIYDDQDNGDNLEITLLSNTIEVYPNPSDCIFHLTVLGKSEGQAILSVYSMAGKKILSQTAYIDPTNNTFDLDLSGYPAGLYLFSAEINGTRLLKKLIVKP
jgi:PKD repeat protein